LARAAYAPGTSFHQQEAQMATDPVCGMDVDEQNAQHTAEHQGTRYYFCSRGCQLDFEEDPERYLDPAYKPSMEGH
jgi:P-type Cu+ transporter